MKLTILGSGTTVPSKERSAPAYLLEVAGKLILLDSGEGTKRRVMEADKDPMDIDYIFYTHTHVDHVAELPAILWAYNWIDRPRTQDLRIFGPKGFKKFFKKMRGSKLKLLNLKIRSLKSMDLLLKPNRSMNRVIR